ncbi:MAG: choice-of-anchor L domain-containing protein [Flavipsychrobacter sp.]|nr:choice-of-anchor L domain-containing protein [Flavipsychrobacter sp.]
MAAKLAGPGISISAPVLTCHNLANGTFTSVTTPITIDSGIVLTTGRAMNTTGMESFLASTNNSRPGDPSLATLAGTTTYDACILEFDFIPKGDTVSFNYQFGSEEYINSTCGQYNDAFAFFISGPGITGAQNMALVPGTNIPVTVNSINSGVPGPPGWPGFCNIANCTAMGPGSPFTGYYVNNTGGTTTTYRGYTAKLAAKHAVTPCVTYHLKLSIADGANGLYDSGVFIEAGSLKANNYVFKRSDSIGHTIAGIPNALVKGCAPATVTVLNSRTTSSPQKVLFTYGGSAVKGTDYTAPDSAFIAPGDTAVAITLTGLATAASGLKTIVIYLSSPFSCGTIDTLSLNLLDAPQLYILTPDTAVCSGVSFQIRTSGSSGLVYNWAPTVGVSSPSAQQPIVAPTVNTVYTVTATLPLSGCLPLPRTLNVSILNVGLSIITPDTAICIGSSLRIQTLGTPGLTYSWAPSTTIDNPTSNSPLATPTSTTIYTVTATTAVGSCKDSRQIKITVIDPKILVSPANYGVCPGATVKFSVTGDAGLLYSWLPTSGLDDPGLMEPTATGSMPMTYTVTATTPGSLCHVKSTVSVVVYPQVNAFGEQISTTCIGQAILLNAFPTGKEFIYSWAGPAAFSSAIPSPSVKNALPANEGTYTLTVTNILTGCVGTDTLFVPVGNDSFTLRNVTPDQTITIGSSIRLNAENAVLYTWTPDDGTIDNPNINNPIVTPTTKTRYTVTALGQNGCIDTAGVTIDVVDNNDLFIPSAFTPNGDGLNDIFRIRHGVSVKVAELRILNRWGQVVFSRPSKSHFGIRQ